MVYNKIIEDINAFIMHKLEYNRRIENIIESNVFTLTHSHILCPFTIDGWLTQWVRNKNELAPKTEKKSLHYNSVTLYDGEREKICVYCVFVYRMCIYIYIYQMCINMNCDGERRFSEPVRAPPHSFSLPSPFVHNYRQCN